MNKTEMVEVNIESSTTSIVIEFKKNLTTSKTSKATRTHPYVIFALFTMLIFVTMMGRSIVAGGSKSFSIFCANSPDAPGFVQESPSAGIGLLVSIFIGGYSLSMIFMSHLTHVMKWKHLVLYAMAIWIAAVFTSGLAGYINSFKLLLFSQMITGVSEAAFQVVAPPLIEERGGARSGLWMSIFFSATPLGLTTGYMFGAIVTNTVHWSWCFYLLGSMNVVLFIAFTFVHDDINQGYLTNSSKRETNIEVTKTSTTASLRHTDSPDSPQKRQYRFAIIEEMLYCFKSKVLCAIVLADAMQIATNTVIATFSASFLLILECYDDSQTATLTFGTIVAIAGVCGSLFGGIIIDRSCEKISTTTSSVEGDDSPTTDSNQVLVVLLPRLSLMIAISLCFLFPTCIPGLPTHIMLILLFFGMFFIFAIQTIIMICTLHSVDSEHRPNAIAFQKFMRHMLGDVPAPVLFGLLKDYLSPSCVFGTDGEFEDDVACKSQKNGVLLTLAVCYTYLGLSIVFFELAHWFAWRNMKHTQESERIRISGSSTTSSMHSLNDFNKEI